MAGILRIKNTLIYEVKLVYKFRYEPKHFVCI